MQLVFFVYFKDAHLCILSSSECDIMCPFLHQHDISVRLYIFIPFCTFLFFFSHFFRFLPCLTSFCLQCKMLHMVCVCAQKLVTATTSHCLWVDSLLSEDVCVRAWSVCVYVRTCGCGSLCYC